MRIPDWSHMSPLESLFFIALFAWGLLWSVAWVFALLGRLF